MRLRLTWRPGGARISAFAASEAEIQLSPACDWQQTPIGISGLSC